MVNRPSKDTARKEYGETALEEEYFLCRYRIDKGEKLAQSYNQSYVTYKALLDGRIQQDERNIPVIPNVTKARHEYNIRKNFDKILAFSEENGILIGNLSWIEPPCNAGVNVFGDYGLNLDNREDFLFACSFGILEVVISPEAGLDEITAMNFTG